MTNTRKIKLKRRQTRKRGGFNEKLFKQLTRLLLTKNYIAIKGILNKKENLSILKDDILLIALENMGDTQSYKFDDSDDSDDDTEENNRIKILELLITKFKEYISKLPEAERNEKYDKFINAKDTIEKTPLHLVVFDRNYNETKLLLDNDADVNAVDKNKNTPLHIFAHSLIFARNKNNEELYKICELLLNSGANIMAEDSKSDTPFNIIKNSNVPKTNKIFILLNKRLNEYEESIRGFKRAAVKKHDEDDDDDDEDEDEEEKKLKDQVRLYSLSKTQKSIK